MVWFFCDGCGDSIKKPKVGQHMRSCRNAWSFTCIDCSRTFDSNSVHTHTSCVTEHEKYAMGATKAGGFASKGFYSEGGGGTGADKQAAGLEFLSQSAPWKCSICNVACTSQETLMGHASGAKHIRRSKAVLAATQEKSQPVSEAGGSVEEAGPADEDSNAVEPKQAKQKKEVKKDKKKSNKRMDSTDGVVVREATEDEEKKKKKKKKEKKENLSPADINDSLAPSEDQKSKKRKKSAADVTDTPSTAEALDDVASKEKSKGKKKKNSKRDSKDTGSEDVTDTKEVKKKKKRKT